jgi:hypothetical protein
MSIQGIPDIKLLQASHRCHQFVLDFVVATASVGSFLNAYHNRLVTTFAPTLDQGIPMYPGCSIAGVASGKTINFIPEDVLRNVFVKQDRTTPIAYLENNTFTQIVGVSTSAVAETIEGFAQAMFTRYWETNLAKIEQTHGMRNAGNWPQLLQFGAVVRDAMSHGGVLHMFPSVKPATHFGITYTQSQNGKRIIHTDLTSADIFLLMLDIDATL